MEAKEELPAKTDEMPGTTQLSFADKADYKKEV